MTTFDPAWAAAQVAGKYPEGHQMGQALNWLIECWVSVESSQVDLELLTAEDGSVGSGRTCWSGTAGSSTAGSETLSEFDAVM
jgi:hypothetical protein